MTNQIQSSKIICLAIMEYRHVMKHPNI